MRRHHYRVEGRGAKGKIVPYTPEEEAARDAEEALARAENAAEHQRALVEAAATLQARIDAALKLSDIPEAATEAQRLQDELTKIKARLAATRSAPERS